MREENYHVILDETSFNHLKIVDHSEYITQYQNYTEVYNGKKEKCIEFHSHFTEEIFYPITEMEELN